MARVLTEKGKVDAELKGNTLRVYVYALKKNRVGVREVQRALGLSNASLAQYHLSKLKDLGLVREENGEYEVMNEVKVDVMRDFLRIRTSLIPRFVFYAVFFTILAGYMGGITVTEYSGLQSRRGSPPSSCVACGIFWYETLRAWRAAPQALNTSAEVGHPIPLYRVSNIGRPIQMAVIKRNCKPRTMRDKTQFGIPIDSQFL